LVARSRRSILRAAVRMNTRGSHRGVVISGCPGYLGKFSKHSGVGTYGKRQQNLPGHFRAFRFPTVFNHAAVRSSCRRPQSPNQEPAMTARPFRLIGLRRVSLEFDPPQAQSCCSTRAAQRKFALFCVLHCAAISASRAACCARANSHQNRSLGRSKAMCSSRSTQLRPESASQRLAECSHSIVQPNALSFRRRKQVADTTHCRASQPLRALFR